MQDDLYRQQYKQLKQLYDSAPNMFDEEQVDSLERMANSVGERFSRNHDAAEINLKDTVSQLASGFVSGFTTINIGDNPENSVEMIARNIGSVMGFLGVIPGLGTTAKLFSTAVARTALGGTKIGSAIAKGFQGLHTVSKKRMSVPMMIGNQVVKKAKGPLSKIDDMAILSSFSQNTRKKIGDSVIEAVRLGAASSASSWQAGVDEMMKGFAFGAVEGGVFRGITNWTDFGTMLNMGGKAAENANTALRMVSSSIYGGLQSRMLGDPLEVQVYHYLLGAYFGKTDIPYERRAAMDFVNSQRTQGENGVLPAEKLVDPNKMEGFDGLTPEVQDEVRHISLVEFGGVSAYGKAFIDDAGQKFTDEMGEGVWSTDAGSILADLVMNDPRAVNYYFAQEFGKRFDKYTDPDRENPLDMDEAIAKVSEEMKGWKPGDVEMQELHKNYRRKKADPERIDPDGLGTNMSRLEVLERVAEEHQMPSSLISPIESVARKLGNSDSFDGDDTAAAKAIGDELIQTVENNEGFDGFASRMKEKFKVDVTSDDDISKNLRRSWLQYERQDIAPQLTYNPETRRLERGKNTLSNDQKITQVRAQSHLEKALGRGKVLITKYFDNGEGKAGKLKEFFQQDTKGAVDDLLNTEDFRQYLIDAARQGRPFIAGKKDTGQFFHMDDWLFNAEIKDPSEPNWHYAFERKLRRLNEIDPEFNQHYKDARRRFYRGAKDVAEQNELKEIYNKYAYNNMLMLEKLNGMSYEEMVRHNKASGENLFVLKAEDLNKRMQPIADGAPGLRVEDFRGTQNQLKAQNGKFRAIIVDSGNSIIEGAKGNREILNDGVTLIHPDVYNDIAYTSGNSTDTGFQKLTFAGATADQKGMLIGKQGVFKATAEEARMMEEMGVQIMMDKTSSKQIGLRDVYKMKLKKDGSYEVLDKKGKAVAKEALNAFDIAPEDMHLNVGVYEKAPENTSIVKQFMLNLESSGARRRLLENVLMPSISGDKELSRRFREGQISEKKLGDLDFDQISMGEIIRTVTQPQNESVQGSKEYSALWKHILKYNDDVDSVDPEVLKDASEMDRRLDDAGVDQFNGAGDRILRMASRNGQITPALIHSKHVNRFAQSALRKYIVNRMVKPKVKHSGTAFSYGQPLSMQRKLGRPLNEGEFMFAKSMKDFKIKWLDGKETTLGKAWDEFQSVKKSAPKSDKAKQMQTLLNFSVIRVPADSPSGTRSLNFAGFSDAEGYGMHVSGKDMEYLGGMDNDGDKVHFYQDLDGRLDSRPIQQDIERVAHEWDGPDGKVTDPKANQEQYRFRDRYNEPWRQGTASGILPDALGEVHLGSVVGNEMLGVAANFRGFATAFRNAYNSSNEQLQRKASTIELKDGDGNPNGYKVVFDRMSGDFQDAMSLRRLFMNMAADATKPFKVNRTNMIKELQAKLFKDKDIRVLNPDGKDITDTAAGRSIKAEHGNITKTEIWKEVRALNRLSQGYDPYSKKGRRADFEQTMDIMRNIVENKKTDGGSTEFTNNVFFDAMILGGKDINANFRKVISEEWREQKAGAVLARYLNRDATQMMDIVTKALENKHVRPILRNSGLQRLFIGNRGFYGSARSYDSHWKIQNDLNVLTSLIYNDATARRVQQDGVPDDRLSYIRRIVDEIKYNYNKTSEFETEDIRKLNYALKERELGWSRDTELSDGEPTLIPKDEVIERAKRLKKELKSEAERDYFDSYMLGSMSEQRFAIDDIAKFELLRAHSEWDLTADEAVEVVHGDLTKAIDIVMSKREDIQSRAEAEAKVNSIRDKVTIGNVEEMAETYSERAANEPDQKRRQYYEEQRDFYANLKDTINRRFDQINHRQLGFTTDLVSSKAVAQWNNYYNLIAQDRGQKGANLFKGVEDPSSSKLIERMLQESLPKKKEVVESVYADFEERNMLAMNEDATSESMARMFEKYSTQNTVADQIEAENASKQGAILAKREGNDFAELIFQKKYLGEKADINYDKSTEEGKYNAELRDRLNSLLTKRPNLGKHLVSLFENTTGKTPQKATKEDLLRFINHMESFDRKLFTEKLLNIKDTSEGVSKAHYFWLPQTLGRRLAGVNDEGNSDARIKTTVRDVLMADGKVKSKEVSEVMSTYESIRRVLSTVEENNSSIKNRLAQFIDEKREFLNHESIAKHKDDMVRVAIARMEKVQADQMRKELKNEKGKDKPNKKRVSYLEHSIGEYEKAIRETQDIYDDLKDQTFKYQEKGKTREVKGSDLMDGDGIIARQINEITNWAKDVFIDPAGAEQFIVRRRDGSIDPDRTLVEMANQFNTARREQDMIANIGLKNMYELAQELSYKYNNRVKYRGEWTRVADIENADDQAFYIRKQRLRDRGIPDGQNESGQTIYRKDSSGRYVLKDTIGLIKDGYFPHVNHSEKAMKEYTEKFFSEDIRNFDRTEAEIDDLLSNSDKIFLQKQMAQGNLDDLGMSTEFIDNLFSDQRQSFRKDTPPVTPYGNLSGRSERVMGGYERSFSALDQYMSGLNKSYHNLYGVVVGQQLARRFRERRPFGDMTEPWAKFMDIYIQDFTGQPSTFPKKYFDDPDLNLRGSLYYLMSDQNMEEQIAKVSKKHKLIGENSPGLRKELKQKWYNRFQAFSRLEGKVSLLTLLANTRSMVNNYVGGSSMTGISAGWKYWKLANNMQYIRDNIDSRIRTTQDMRDFAIKHGAIEAYVEGEIGQLVKSRVKTKDIAREIADVMKKNPDAELNVKEILQRNGITDAVTQVGAQFMSKVERRLRTRAFWAHYLKARDTLMLSNADAPIDDPWLIKMAQRGVWGTQFLYNNANRPAIARTNLGRVFSRFQLWSWNSVKFRRDIIGDAQRMGFREGTNEFERFKRLAQADMFMFGLASAFPISMFESILPSPLNYIQDFSDYFFGDEEERDRSFYGTIPYPFSPLQATLPPSARYITTPVELATAGVKMMLDQDVNDMLDYKVFSMMPFGLLGRNIYKSAKSPAMMPDFMTGIPLHRIGSEIKSLREDDSMIYNGIYKKEE